VTSSTAITRLFSPLYFIMPFFWHEHILRIISHHVSLFRYACTRIIPHDVRVAPLGGLYAIPRHLL